MDRKEFIITLLGLIVLILLGVWTFFEFSSIERELVNTKNELEKTKAELTKSQEESYSLNLQITKAQKYADDLKAQLDDAKHTLRILQEQNFHLGKQSIMLNNQLRALREGLVKEGYSGVSNDKHF